MIRVIEVFGSSSNNYDDAAKNAVDSLVKNGEKVRFYREEMRGIREHSGKKEYSVKLKVAVSIF